MCGIFGLIRTENSNISNFDTRKLIDKLFIFSQTRGREAAGVAVTNNNYIDLFKQGGKPKDLIKNKKYISILDKAFKSNLDNGLIYQNPIAIIGHSRLVTNGCHTDNNNNQPIFIPGMVGVHNGIITNELEILNSNKDIKKEIEVDTEIFLKLFKKNLSSLKNIDSSIKKTFDEIEGTASVGILSQSGNKLFLATNNGSLFFVENKDSSLFIFASERYILKKIIKLKIANFGFENSNIKKLKPYEYLIKSIKTKSQKIDNFCFEDFTKNDLIKSTKNPINFIDHSHKNVLLKRCKKCILPETYPFLEIDDSGVCRYCRQHKYSPVLGENILKEKIKDFKNKDGKPDCIVALSGGRDSCYGLHYIKKELGMNPIAFTYDWGMVNDLARRNCARVCGELGIEHIIRTPNISIKRKNIRKNVEAWLKKPELGMVPLFMAGDKAFFKYARQLKRETGIKLVFFCAGNEMENCPYKFGFSGIRNDDSANILTGLKFLNKLKLIKYYGTNFLLNPYYLNSSLIDSAAAFWHTFVAKDEFIYLYKYLEWREDIVVNTIKEKYNWETSKDTKTTWRIGDATAAFYNYIYQTLAGFTEDDDMLSNMIRDGYITREEALQRSVEYAQPRLESIKEYTDKIGINFEETIGRINSINKIF